MVLTPNSLRFTDCQGAFIDPMGFASAFVCFITIFLGEFLALPLRAPLRGRSNAPPALGRRQASLSYPGASFGVPFDVLLPNVV